MRLAISLAMLALIVAGVVMLWRSGQTMPGLPLIMIGLAINTIMAASRHWRPAKSEKQQ